MITTLPPSTTPNNITSPATPIHLPVEIYLNVIPLLAKPELVLCCRVSQFFNSVITPKLYKALHEEFGENPSFTIPLLVGATSEKGPAGTGGEAMGIGDGPGSDVGKELNMPNLEMSDVKPIPRFIPHHDRFSFTTYLTISPHVRELCESLETLELPNLITLRILGVGMEHCEPTKTVFDATPCPFIACLRPRRIVLGGHTCTTLPPVTFSPEIELQISVPDFPPNTVTELVVIIGLDIEDHDGGLLYYITESFPATLDRLTIVIEDQSAGEASPTRPDSAEEVALAQRKLRQGRSLLTAMFGALARQGKVRSVTVVGSEGVSLPHPRILSPTVQDIKAALAVNLGSMRSRWSVKAAADTAEEVKFVEMKDYDGEVR